MMSFKVKCLAGKTLLFVGQVKSHCVEAVDHGAMVVLRHLYDSYGCIPDVVHAIARVISSMSMYAELHDAIFTAGLIHCRFSTQTLFFTQANIICR